MADTVTLALLSERVRFRSGLNSSTKLTPTRLTEEVNAAIKRLWTLLLQHRADAYVKEQSPAPTTTAGSTIVTLAADFYRLMMVEILEGSEYTKMHPHNLQERGLLERMTATPRNLRYRFQAATTGNGPVLRLAPVPVAVHTLRISYLPSFTDLALDADTFDGVAGYEDLVIADAVAVIKGRESMPGASHWQGVADALRKEITTASSNIDTGTPFSLAGRSRAMDDLDDEWFPI